MDTKELRARCAVFNDHPDDRRAPDGWCEIQANDSIDVDGEWKPFESDEEAALAVALAGGAKGYAWHYEVHSGLWEPVPRDGTPVDPERWNALNLMAGTLDDEEDEGEGERRWIVVVPRPVAAAAGLDLYTPKTPTEDLAALFGDPATRSQDVVDALSAVETLDNDDEELAAAVLVLVREAVARK